MVVGSTEFRRCVVFAPSPLLTVAIEHGGRGDEIRLHAGGQGFWIARLVAKWGIPVTLCTTLGGEAGLVVSMLAGEANLTLRPVLTGSRNGAYVHDRRDGTRVPVAEMAPAPLSRHDVDDLYGTTVVEGLDADVVVLGGPDTSPDLLPPDTYRRLAVDLRRQRRAVVADLSSGSQAAALRGGVTVVKVSSEELLRDGQATDQSFDSTLGAMESLKAAGAERVVVTRGEEPTLALTEDHRCLEVSAPRLEPVEDCGRDSSTAGLVAGLARHQSFEDSLRLGAAAGSLNVTRKGLANAGRGEIFRLTRHVVLREVERLR